MNYVSKIRLYVYKSEGLTGSSHKTRRNVEIFFFLCVFVENKEHVDCLNVERNIFG